MKDNIFNHSQSSPIRRRQVFASLLIALLIASAGFGLTARTTGGHIVWSDGAAYFLYARSLLLDGDANLTNEYAELTVRYGSDAKWLQQLHDWSWRSADGQQLITPWPAGAGAVMVPFYALGYAIEHGLARWFERPADSYGLVAQAGFALGSVIYALIGFWAMVATAHRLCRFGPAIWAALGIAFAGPLVFYAFAHPSMAHAASFGLVALACWLFLRLWQNGLTLAPLATLGLLCGVLVTVRYQNVLLGVLPAVLLMRELWRRPGWAIGAGVVALGATALPLLALITQGGFGQAATIGQVGTAGPWQLQLGAYPFDLRSPYFVDVLMSCRHGAFYWAPLLGVAALGLLVAALYARSWAAVLLGVFLLQVYLIGALGLIGNGFQFNDWLNHWDGAPSFGMRYLTESGPLLAPGLALVLQWLWYRLGSWSAIVLVGIACAWNGLLVLSYGLGTLSRSQCVTYGDMLAAIIALK